MEGSQQIPAVGPKEINPRFRLSAEDFLYSLARTPNPTRFDRRRRRLLEGKPRLARVSRLIEDAGRATAVGAGSSQPDQAPIDAMIRAPPPLDAEYCQRPLNHELDGLTVEHDIRVAALALLNPSIDGEREANEGMEGKRSDADHLPRQLLLSPLEFPPLSGEQQYRENSSDRSMFVCADAIDEDEECDDISSKIFGHGRPIEPSLEFAGPSDFDGTHSQPSGAEHDVANGEHGCIETTMLDEIEHISLQPQQNLPPSSKRKLRRPGREQLIRLKTYGNRIPPGREQPANKTRVLHRLAVDGLDLVLDQVPPNPVYASDADATEFDDDPIQEASSPPLKSSKARKRHNVGKVVKKRKLLNETRQKVFKHDAIELSKYRLPNSYGMSPKTKKTLEMSMKCSDGFEGRESQPTGKTMSMRLPRRHPQVSRQIFARVTELTFTSCRDINENIENPQGLQGEPFQSNAFTMLYREGNDIITDAFSPLIDHAPEIPGKVKKIQREGGNLQLGNLKKLASPFRGSDKHTQETTVVITPPSTDRPKRRVTFRADVRAKTLQTLAMVSAPIAIASPCDSEESEPCTTDDDCDRTSSESYDEDGSDKEAEGDSDDCHSSEDGNSDIRTDTEDDEALQRSTAPLDATFQSLRHTEEPLKHLKQGKAQKCQQLSLTDDSRRCTCVCHDDMHQRDYSPHPSYAQSPIRRGKALIAGEGRQRQEMKEDDHWRPRKPVSTCHLIEADDEIFDYPSSPTKLSEYNDESRTFYSASARRSKVQSCDDHHPSRIQVARECMEDLQERKQSQASVELGDPNWSVPYGSEDELSYFQAKNSDFPTGDSHRHVAEYHPTYLARVLDSFNNPSHGNSSLVQSKSMPPNHRFHYVNQQVQEDHIAGNLEIRPAFKQTKSPPKHPPSQKKSPDLRALAGDVSNDASTTLVRGRIQPLSFKPPFLRD